MSVPYLIANSNVIVQLRLILFVIGGIKFVGCYSFQQSVFIKDVIHDVQKRVEDGCSREMPQYDKLSCLIGCGLDISCIGASLEKTTRKCFFHRVCSPSTTYVTPDIKHDYYARYCVHGLWDYIRRLCECSYMTFGKRCEKAYQHPTDYLRFKKTNPLVFIDPKQDGDLYKVRLRQSIKDNKSSVYLAVNDGRGNFNRTWNEYLIGFDEVGGHSHWIGLKTWNVLSKIERCSMTRTMLVTDELKLVRYYENFIIRDKMDNFSFTFERSYWRFYGDNVGNYSFGECMKNIQNISFSTWDRRNDGVYKNEGGGQMSNCQSEAGYGWWHLPTCHNPCNFLGWGLPDWNIAPELLRLSVLGVNMSKVATEVNEFRMFLKCDP